MKFFLAILLTLALVLTGFAGCDKEVTTTSEGDVEVAKGDITYVITDTGQTGAYGMDGEEISPVQGEALYGQDAHYTGLEPSFTDNGDGTITDNLTGLMWQMIPVSEYFTWDEAQEYCEDLSLAGYDDWRLPTAKELFGISDFSVGWPFLDTNYFEFPEMPGSAGAGRPQGDETQQAEAKPGGGPGGGSSDNEGERPDGGQPQGERPEGADENAGAEFPENEESSESREEMPPASSDESTDGGGISKQQGQFWTSNFYYIGTTHDGEDTAFGVNHATGHIKGYPTGRGGDGAIGRYVRAVRGVDTSVNNFVDNGDGTISDLATGLMWMTDDSGAAVNWKDALSYAENLSLAGYDDWRLPNVKELQSIVDYSGSFPAIDPTFFNITTELEDNVNCYFWTSTSAYFSKQEPEYYYAWYVAFGKAVGPDGEDTHGAGAVRFSAKYPENDIKEEDTGNSLNSVRCVRDID